MPLLVPWLYVSTVRLSTWENHGEEDCEGEMRWHLQLSWSWWHLGDPFRHSFGHSRSHHGPEEDKHSLFHVQTRAWNHHFWWYESWLSCVCFVQVLSDWTAEHDWKPPCTWASCTRQLYATYHHNLELCLLPVSPRHTGTHYQLPAVYGVNTPNHHWQCIWLLLNLYNQ